MACKKQKEKIQRKRETQERKAYLSALMESGVAGSLSPYIQIYKLYNE
jgi:hypothetical protein